MAASKRSQKLHAQKDWSSNMPRDRRDQTPQEPNPFDERVVHIDRTNLLPYKQEIYDQSGQIVTRALYSQYKLFGNIQYPMRIQIERPLDHYALNLTITRITLNQPLDDEQFDLKIPDGIPTQEMR